MTPPARSLFRFLASSNADNLPLALWLTSTPATHSHTTRQCRCDAVPLSLALGASGNVGSLVLLLIPTPQL